MSEVLLGYIAYWFLRNEFARTVNEIHDSAFRNCTDPKGDALRQWEMNEITDFGIVKGLSLVNISDPLKPEDIVNRTFSKSFLGGNFTGSVNVSDVRIRGWKSLKRRGDSYISLMDPYHLFPRLKFPLSLENVGFSANVSGVLDGLFQRNVKLNISAESIDFEVRISLQGEQPRLESIEITASKGLSRTLPYIFMGSIEDAVRSIGEEFVHPDFHMLFADVWSRRLERYFFPPRQ